LALIGFELALRIAPIVDSIHTIGFDLSIFFFSGHRLSRQLWGPVDRFVR
jgi:hypothetical protein